MKQEIAKIWVEALRSGEYTQGRTCLKSTSGDHCCLGVLCELYDKHNEEKLSKKELDDMVFFSGLARLLPFEVMEWAGLRWSDGSIDWEIRNDYVFGHTTNESLASLNDGGNSFHAIANIIEQNVEAL